MSSRTSRKSSKVGPKATSKRVAAKPKLLAFFRGRSLRPPPPIESKDEETRCLHIHEDDPLDDAQLATWIRQAAALPGWLR